jgi:2'-5' RNA ligase
LRLFTGISLPAIVVANIDDVIATLRPLAPSGTRWSPAENLHITTKFIGQWPEDGLDELKQTLGTMERHGAIPIRIATLGFVPGVLFAAVDGGDRLPQLAASTDRTLERLGCTPEKRSYRPHLTLARFKGAKIQSLRTHIQSLPTSEFGSFDATEFHLYLSKPGPDGSIYTILESWNLV